MNWAQITSYCKQLKGKVKEKWDKRTPITGHWKQFKGKVKEKYGKLTHNDVTAIAGKRDQLTARLQEKHSQERDQADKELDAFSQALKPSALPKVN
jgi:uncharacterized protein YjbJ (UPF0337 family)